MTLATTQLEDQAEIGGCLDAVADFLCAPRGAG